MVLRSMPPVTSQQVFFQGTGIPTENKCVLNHYAQRQLSSCHGQWDGDVCSFDVPH